MEFSFKKYLHNFGTVGVLMAISACSYLVLLVLFIALGNARFESIFPFLSLPMGLENAVRHPWTLFSFWAVNHPTAVFMQLVDLALMFSFGMLLQNLAGRNRFNWLALIYISSVGLFTLLLANVLPTVSKTDTTPLFGMHGLNAAIIAAVITLAPRMRVRLFVWETELVWVGLITLLLPLVAYRAIFTVMGTSVLVGIVTGGLSALVLEQQLGRLIPRRPKLTQVQDPQPRDRVRVRETRPNPQHKGKFTVLSGGHAHEPEDELDRLLDRINEVGYEGLTLAEKRRLEELSND